MMLGVRDTDLGCLAVERWSIAAHVRSRPDHSSVVTSAIGEATLALSGTFASGCPQVASGFLHVVLQSARA